MTVMLELMHSSTYVATRYPETSFLMSSQALTYVSIENRVRNEARNHGPTVHKLG